MSGCAAFDPQRAADTLHDALQAELRKQGFEQRVIEGVALQMLADLLECPPDVARGLLTGKGACARVVCLLKDRVAGGGGLQGARRHKAAEWERIQARQDEAIRRVKADVAAGRVERWHHASPITD